MPINDSVIKKNAPSLQRRINHILLSEKRIYTKFSYGWSWQFKKLNKFERFIMVQVIQILREKLSNYRLNDLWNANVFG